MNINTSLFEIPKELDELGTRDSVTNAYAHALAYLTAVRSAVDGAGTRYPEHLASGDQNDFNTARTGLIAELDPAIAFARTIVDLIRK